MSPDGAPVVCRGVVKTHVSPAGAVEALHALDADFPPASLSAVIGPSGAGKSTLLRLLAGLDGLTAGEIHVGETALATLRGRALRTYRREEATYVAQKAADNLIPHLTLREHAAQGSDLSLLSRLGLQSRLDARAGELSGGEQARAALGIALLRQTPILLVDEPTAELDRETAGHVLDALSRRAREGATVVVATHDPEAIAAADVRLTLDRAQPGAATHATVAVQSAIDAVVVLEAAGVTKAYGDSTVVDDVSVVLHAGETSVLLGRSGSGKSTLMMLLGGWLEPDAGAIRVAGATIDDTPSWGLVGYLPQRFGLLPELSVRDNVLLPLRLSGGLAGRGDADGLLDQLGLLALADRFPAETSIGQQQRAALARAVIARPTVLLVDEPTSHQDGAFAARVREVLVDACAAGSACVVATHDPAAATHGGVIWEMADGRVTRSMSI